MASPIDHLFKEIFGFIPSKPGTAFEQLSAIATHLIQDSGFVTHDTKLHGAYSSTQYQVDVLHQADEGKSMGEAKDYTDAGKKVGRPDLQKLNGALLDLADVDKGVFWSATSYSGPARKYAQASRAMGGKEIALMGLRESTPADEQGYVRTVRVTSHINVAQLQRFVLTPHWTPRGRDLLLSGVSKGQSIELSIAVDDIFNSDGEVISSVFKLTSKGYGVIGDDSVSRGCYWLPEHFLKVNGLLAGIYGLEYELPYVTYTHSFEITDDSKYRLVVLDEAGEPLRILTDEKLREFTFDAEGQLIAPPKPISPI